MPRKVPGNNWIKGWHYWLQESEAPNSYISWAAISAIAGSTKRRVSMEWVYHTYYPNFYIVLVGPAGTVHKSSTIDMVRRVLQEIKVPTASEAVTKEALINMLKDRSHDQKTCALTALPDEFSDFIRASGPAMFEFLTSVYGCPNYWEYTTLKRGTDAITNAYLNILAGTTPSWIANEFDATFTEQGFASRTLFVYETEPRFRKAKVNITPEMRKMYTLLVDDLFHISELQGTFEWEDNSVYDQFANWYENILPAEIQKADYRIKSYLARKPTHLLKLMMILQLAESDELILTQDKYQQSKLLLDNLEVSMSSTFSAVGRNQYANDLERIYHEVHASGGMSLQEIWRKNYSAFATKQSFDETMETLCIMGLLTRTTNGKGVIYVARD